MLRGTKILCAELDENEVIQGDVYIPIEDIKYGYIIKTFNHGYKPVEYIQTFDIENPDMLEDDTLSTKRLYTLSSEKYEDLTEGDLVLVGMHCLLKEDDTEMIREKALSILKSFNNERAEKEVNKAFDLVANTVKISSLDGKKCVPVRDEMGKAAFYPVAGTHKVYQLCFDQGKMEYNYGIYANGLLVESTSI